MLARTRTCRSHCRSCGRHFANDAAFDRHRVGRTGNRRCQDPADDDWYEVIDGDCRIGDASPLSGVVIYRRAGTAERIKAIVGGEPAQACTAKSQALAGVPA